MPQPLFRARVLRTVAALVLFLARPGTAGTPPVAERVTKRIHASLPAARVDVVNPGLLAVELQGVARVEVNLANVERACEDVSACASAIDALVAALKDRFERFTRVPERSQVRVRLISRQLIDEMEEQARQAAPDAGSRPQLVARELVSGLWQVLVIDTPESLRMLQRTVAKKLARTDAELFALGIANLRGALPRPTFQPMFATPRLKIQASPTDGYDSAYVLLPDLVLGSAELGSRMVVAVPSRDTLLVAREQDAASLAQVAKKLHATAPYPVSGEVYLLTQKGLAPFVVP